MVSICNNPSLYRAILEVVVFVKIRVCTLNKSRVYSKAIAKGFYANDAVVEVLIGLTKFSPSSADNWPDLHTLQ